MTIRLPEMDSGIRHIGMLRQGRSFEKAARYIDEACRARKQKHQPYMHVDIDLYDVFCYLCSHAIELALKSILMLNGKDESHLKKLGHDLEAILTQVENCDEPVTNKILNNDLKFMIEWLNLYYKSKELEYYKGPSYSQMPQSDQLLEITSNLVSILDEEYRAISRRL